MRVQWNILFDAFRICCLLYGQCYELTVLVKHRGRVLPLHVICEIRKKVSGNPAVKLATIIIIAKVKNRGSPLLINQVIVLESQLFESSLH